MMLLAYGTSYTQDMNKQAHLSVEQNKQYRDYNQQCWVQYLGTKLDIDCKNMGVAGFGIDSYFARIADSILHYPQTNIALIEVPTPFRNHFHLLAKKQLKTNASQLEYWQKIDREDYSYHSPQYKTPDCNKHTVLLNQNLAGRTLEELETWFLKRLTFNSYAQIPITKEDMMGACSFLAKSDLEQHTREIISKCIHIDGFLKYKNIETFWWSFTPNVFDIIDSVPGNQQLNWLSKNCLLDWCIERGWTRDSDKFADGHHLNSKEMKIAADEYFLPHLPSCSMRQAL